MNKFVPLVAVLCFADFSCMTTQVMNYRRSEAIRSAKFDTGCQDIQVVDEMVGSDSSARYRLSGCGREYIYICENTKQQDTLDLMVVGGQTIDTKCRLQNTTISYAPPRQSGVEQMYQQSVFFLRENQCDGSRCRPCPNWISKDTCEKGGNTCRKLVDIPRPKCKTNVEASSTQPTTQPSRERETPKE